MKDECLQTLALFWGQRCLGLRSTSVSLVVGQSGLTKKSLNCSGHTALEKRRECWRWAARALLAWDLEQADYRPVLGMTRILAKVQSLWPWEKVESNMNGVIWAGQAKRHDISSSWWIGFCCSEVEVWWQMLPKESRAQATWGMWGAPMRM